MFLITAVLYNHDEVLLYTYSPLFPTTPCFSNQHIMDAEIKSDQATYLALVGPWSNDYLNAFSKDPE